MSIQYLLTNVNYDNTYKNMPYFIDETSRDDAIIGNRTFTETSHNFNYGNILYTSFVVNSYNNENYIVIKDNNKYWYYFISAIEYKAVNQWRLSLELDVITQYMTRLDGSVLSNCYVERAHCNRFTILDEGEKTVKFDVTNGSQIIKTEKNIEMITTSRNEIQQIYSNNDLINTWINSNILCWVYYYLDTKQHYKFMGATYNGGVTPDTFTTKLTNNTYNIGDTTVNNEYTVIACPIYKTSLRICLLDVEHQQSAYIDKINMFRYLNNDNSYIYNIKFSCKPPVDFNDIEQYTTIDENGNLIINYQATYGIVCYESWNIGDTHVYGNYPITLADINGTLTAHRDSACFVNVNSQQMKFETIETGTPDSFYVTNIVGNERNIEFEPKIYVDCKHIVLRDSSNGEWMYYPLYFSTSSATPLYDEPLNITNTNYYYRMQPEGIIPQQDADNWTGICNTVDYSQQIANNTYENFIANNKNFLLSKQVQQIPNIAMLATGDFTQLGNIASSVYNTLTDINTIQNKPNTMSCVNDTVELNLTVNDGIKLYVDMEEAREVDMLQYYNDVYSNGYSINKFCNPCNYISTRKYFNYIKCELEGVNISAPDNVTNKIREIFRNGVRLWNNYNNMYNYDLENYEIWMERLI